jgi:uncharacterized spore protein YtfJ
MSSPAPFESIAALLARSLDIRHVYGEPVHHGDRTVIPVAQLACIFGAGGGRGPGHTRKTPQVPAQDAPSNTPDAEGAGGGGVARMTPVGALEIGPQGIRFVHFRPLPPLFAAAALGLAIGWLLAGIERRRRR